MSRFSFQNLTDKTISIEIEPWLDTVILEPRAQADLSYEEPAEIDFAFSNDGPVIWIKSDRVTVYTNGDERTFVWPEESP